MTLNQSSGFQGPSPVEPDAIDAHSPNAVRGEMPLTLSLLHGGEIRVTLRYELLGRAGAPLLIIAGGISAGRHVLSSAQFPDAGWWGVPGRQPRRRRVSRSFVRLDRRGWRCRPAGRSR